MTFTDEQKAALARPLDPERVKSRPGPRNSRLVYLEGYDVIRTANEVFGFDGWRFEIQGLHTVDGGMVAHVRVTVGDVVREDVGFGDGNEELAHKEAVTDALKRAFRTFGDQFGNGLYDKDAASPAPRQQKSEGSHVFDWWQAVQNEALEQKVSSDTLAAYLGCEKRQMKDAARKWLSEQNGGTTPENVRALVRTAFLATEEVTA